MSCNSKEVLEEVRSVLQQNTITKNLPLDSDIVALSTVIEFYDEYNKEYEKIRYKYNNKIKGEVIRHGGFDDFYDSVSVEITPDRINIDCRHYGERELETAFKKVFDDIHVVKNENKEEEEEYGPSLDLIKHLAPIIKEAFHEIDKVSVVETEKVSNIPTIGSKLQVSIDSGSVRVTMPNDDKLDFELVHVYDCGDSVESVSLNIVTELSSKVTGIFDKIFIYVKDCPKWCQDKLQERLRLHNLEQELTRKAEEEKIKREQEKQERKARRKSLLKEFFFRKKDED